MFLTRFVIFYVLAKISAADSESTLNTIVTRLEISSNETSASSVNFTSTEHVTRTDDSAFTSPDVPPNSTVISDDETTKTSIIGSDHDIEITGTATPPSVGTVLIELSTEDDRTEIDTFNGTSEFTTTEKNEDLSTCSLNPCKNGGICVEDASVPLLFSCICPSGYVGIRCGTVDKCVTGEDGQLCTNGACVYSEDGLLRSCQCFSGLYWDETKKECRDSDPPCFPNPCMNGGSCSNDNGMPHCDCLPGYEEKNCSVLNKCGNCANGTCKQDGQQPLKFCKCNEGLYWNEEHQSCQVMTSPCDSNPCQHGGMCDASLNSTKFNCSCQIGFSGEACETTEKCSEDKDCLHGVCVFSKDKMVRSCECSKGFYLEEHSHTCKEITNICQPNQCLNDGICTVVSATSYNCTCSEGYVGEKCEVRDLCFMDGGNAFCSEGDCKSNSEQGVYICFCNKTEYFQYTQRKCVELDFCPITICDSTEIVCVMGECLCGEHYKRDNVTLKCIADFCASNPCPRPEMICEEGTGEADYKCSCPDGYSFDGTKCNEASCLFPQLNPCNQYCSLKEDGHDCKCAEDFELKEDNHTCTYIGNNTCSNKTCDNGFCVKEDNMEKCICLQGFTEIDGLCKDVCSSGDLTQGICPSDQCEVSTGGSFRCKCEGKLDLSKDKTTCMVRNVCKEGEIGWKTCKEKNTECVVDWLSSDGYHCPCTRGKISTEGGICRDICSLESNQRECSIKGANCDVDNERRMICKCPPYFTANERDGKCTKPADFSYLITLPLDKSIYLEQNRRKRSLDSSINYRRVSSDVTATMNEMFTSFTQANILSCKIVSEYVLCKIELQFERESITDLKRLKIGDVCINDAVAYDCLLPPSLVLMKSKINENVIIQPTNPCDEEIKNEVCGSDTTCISSLPQKSFNCSCKPGYFSRKKTYPFGDTRSFIEACSDIDECEDDNPCPANSKCENTIGSYTCSCNPGFRGIKDASGADNQKCVEICRPNPCMHGHCSRREDHEFDCRCDAGYAGRLCNMQDDHFKSAKTNTIIVGVVLGGALLITFILFAACISRLRKKKMLENPAHMFYSSTEMTERRHAEGGAANNAFQRE